MYIDTLQSTLPAQQPLCHQVAQIRCLISVCWGSRLRLHGVGLQLLVLRDLRALRLLRLRRRLRLRGLLRGNLCEEITKRKFLLVCACRSIGTRCT